MGRPRTKFLDVELPECQLERRKILNRLYNRNRPKVLKVKKDQPRQGQVAAAPVPVAPPVVAAALGECNCSREVHYLQIIRMSSTKTLG